METKFKRNNLTTGGYNAGITANNVNNYSPLSYSKEEIVTAFENPAVFNNFFEQKSQQGTNYQPSETTADKKVSWFLNTINTSQYLPKRSLSFTLNMDVQ